MKCTYCNEEIDKNDNFCHECGHWTAKGYSLLQKKKIKKSINTKKSNKLLTLIYLFIICIFIFTIMISVRGKSLFKPFAYLEKQIISKKNGYEVTLMENDNKYQNEIINSYDEATNFIKKDFESQKYLCLNSNEVTKLEYNLENNYHIPSISFCDMDYEMAKKINGVIEKMYSLFPNIHSSLTNITMANIENKSLIAYFQPMYQFVNIDEDNNKVNKTQILLNSYYFLNNNEIRDNWYVNDATKESIIAHEFGHFLSFLCLLKKHNLESIIYETKDNSDIINTVIREYESGSNAKLIVEEALNNYNKNLGTFIDVKEFAGTISLYAKNEDLFGNIIYDEVIAEAVHDYYLHGIKMQNSSSEIINVIKGKLR